jgi:hypothetical protein
MLTDWPLYQTSARNGPTLQFDQSTNRIAYQPAANGDVLPDFSSAGYHRANTPLPASSSIPTRITLSPPNADASAAIQEALDAIAAMPSDGRGIKGALWARSYLVDEADARADC